MTKRLLITGFALLLAFAGFSKAVKVETAALVAKNFYFERSSAKELAYSSIKPKLVYQSGTKGEDALFYAFNIADQAFVLVSGDDQTIPVLGFSFESAWGEKEIPVQMTDWLQSCSEQITYLRNHPLNENAELMNNWESLTTSDPSALNSGKSANTIVGPYLTSLWDQGNPYNEFCPVDAAGPGGKALVGCVATAMAQIMYYYRWPETGVGSHGYNSDYGYLNVNFGNTTYNWNRMLNSLNANNVDVATISYHCGVAVDMGYSPTGSGAYSWDAADAMKNNFRYSTSLSLVDKDSYSDAAWATLLKAQLDAKKPMYYHGFGSGGGHAFNVDGYQDGNYFHFNWGWSGSYNGYFYLNNLNPGYNFTSGQGAIINIFPAGNYPPNCSGTTALTAMAGTFEDGSGPLNYPGNNDCFYLITPQVAPTDSVSNITLKFSYFDTEDSQDLLSIYDGPNANSPLIGTYSGNTIPANITSTNNQVYLHFTSNNSQHGNGWFISYEAKQPLFCHPLDEITTPTGILEDGSGTKNYRNKSICQWLIHPSQGQQISLTFDQFSLDNTGDFVEVFAFDTILGDGVLIGHFTGQSLPPVCISNTGAMFVCFSSNSSTTGAGWKAHYVSQTVGIEDNKLVRDLTIFPNPASQNVEVRFSTDCSDAIGLSLITPAGLEIKSIQLESQAGKVSHQIDIEDLAKGIYFIRIRSCRGDSMQKLIVQ